MTDVQIEVEGLDILERNLAKFDRQIKQYLSQAGQQAAREILSLEGLKRYPPATAANRPGRIKQVTFGNGKTVNFRMGYYIRGRGMQVPTRDGGYKDLANSQRLGTQWYIQRDGYGTAIGNRSTYAKYVHGDQQPEFMADKGWLKLGDVAKEQIGRVTEIYQKWINKLIADTEMK